MQQAKHSAVENNEYEALVLGACLRFPENIPTVFDNLTQEDFTLPKHKAIVSGIRAIREKGVPLDPLILGNEIRHAGEDVLHSEIIELMDSYFDGLDLKFYIGELQNFTTRRKLQKVLADASVRVGDPSLDYRQMQTDILRNVVTILEPEPEPVPQQEPQLDDFPREAIKGLAREYADLYSGYLESPWSFWAFSFLTCLGAVISDRLTLQSTLRPQPRLFTILLGQSADDRKSECIKQTDFIFKEALGDDFKTSFGVGSAEGLGEKFRKDSKIVLMYDEFKVFCQKANILGAILLPAINTLFESNKFHSQTKQSAIEIDNGYLSLLGASTIDTFQKMWSDTFTDIGFINRLWLVPDRATKKISIPPMIPENSRTKLKERLKATVNSIPREKMELKIVPDAHDVFDKWYQETPRSLFTKRLDTYGHRLMVLFCANEGKAIITQEIAERVIKLLEWQLRVREQYDVIDAEGKIARMEEAIRRILKNNPKGTTRRELQRNTNANRYGIFVFNSAIKNLTDDRQIEFHNRSKTYQILKK